MFRQSILCKLQQDTNHPSTNKICPIFFIKKRENQSIKTLQKVRNKTASSIYKSRHPSSDSMYAIVAKKQSISNTTNSTVNPNTCQHNRTAISYYDLIAFTNLDHPSTSITSISARIVPQASTYKKSKYPSQNYIQKKES